MASPRLVDGFVVTASEFLPGDTDTTNTEHLLAYGAALGTLCRVSAQRPELMAHASPFRPLEKMHSTLSYLRETPVSPVPGVSWPTPQFLDMYAGLLEQGEQNVVKLLERNAAKGHPEAVMQYDITTTNARLDANGIVTIIDLDSMRGPAEFSLGRLDQWTRNFGRAPYRAEAIQSGFANALGRPLDPEMLKMSIDISRLKYAATALDQVVQAVQQGVPPNGWAVSEGPRRLLMLGGQSGRVILTRISWYNKVPWILDDTA